MSDMMLAIAIMMGDWVDAAVAVSHENFIQCGLRMHVQYEQLL